MDASAGKVRNIVLTGPNAGGKSTYLVGTSISILLSQTLGIALAKEAAITPFNKINTYINMDGDVAAGKSLFMAEVDRAQKHLTALKNLQSHEFSFSIMDELFSGTNPFDGEAGAFSVAKYMSRYDNAFHIFATHFPKMMLLPERVPQGGFANYKVYIVTDETTKKLKYTYRIVTGKSTQSIGIDIFEQVGYDPAIIKDARDIIEHPENYSATFKEPKAR